MKYIDVAWRHDFVDEPVRLVSELDELRFETRKLEFFRDGRVGFAYADIEMLDTRLGYLQCPPVDEINADPQFHVVELSAQEFERLWARYVVL